MLYLLEYNGPLPSDNFQDRIFLVIDEKIHLDTSIIESGSHLSVYLCSIFYRIGIGIFEPIRINISSLYSYIYSCSMTGEVSSSCIISPSKGAIPIVDRISSFCKGIYSRHFHGKSSSHRLHSNRHGSGTNILSVW